VTDAASPVPQSPAVFRGPVTCRRSGAALTLIGAAADSAEDILILTFIASTTPNIPDSLADAGIHALDQGHYRIVSGSRDWIVEATAVHVHRDVGAAFYRAIPPRIAPLRRRFFWRVVLALVGTRAGKRILLSVRR
jgi:hypothetical protein